MLTNAQLFQRLTALEEAFDDRLDRLAAENAALAERIAMLEGGPAVETSAAVIGDVVSLDWSPKSVSITRSVDGPLPVSGDVKDSAMIEFVAGLPVKVALDRDGMVVKVGAHEFRRGY